MPERRAEPSAKTIAAAEAAYARVGAALRELEPEHAEAVRELVAAAKEYGAAGETRDEARYRASASRLALRVELIALELAKRRQGVLW